MIKVLVGIEELSILKVIWSWSWKVSWEVMREWRSI